MKLRDKLLARPGRPLRLADWDPDDTLGFKKDDAAGGALDAQESGFATSPSHTFSLRRSKPRR
jgi:hypothetical protein